MERRRMGYGKWALHLSRGEWHVKAYLWYYVICRRHISQSRKSQEKGKDGQS
jgi:hypothetical protein